MLHEDITTVRHLLSGAFLCVIDTWSLELIMNATNNTLSPLRHELEFLDQGGYRTPIGSRQPLFCMETAAEWRQPLFFEDSPSCPKKRYEACYPERACVLMSFLPMEQR